MDSPIQRRQTLHRQIQAGQNRINTLESEIRQTQKLASIGTMTCQVAHEFNNLLTPIINYAELALKDPQDLQLMQKALQKAVKQGVRAADVVHSILGFARSHDQTPQPTAIAALVEECFQCLARDFKKDRITVVNNIPPDLTAQLFPGQIQQVLLNLIINARHALLEHGGTLTIEAGSINQDRIRIRITDTGCGITPENLEKVFEPFFSTKTDPDRPDQQGTGLGLAVCRDIIHDHHGEITVQSQPDAGTTFTITLPTLQPQNHSPQPALAHQT